MNTPSLAEPPPPPPTCTSLKTLPRPFSFVVLEKKTLWESLLRSVCAYLARACARFRVVPFQRLRSYRIHPYYGDRLFPRYY